MSLNRIHLGRAGAWLGAGVLGAGLMLTASPAEARPPSHAPAWGHRRNHQTRRVYRPVRNPRPWDLDRDGIPNWRDRDIDGDGIRNGRDRRDYRYRAGSHRYRRGDWVNRYGRRDSDRDGIRNEIDRDVDGDGIRNSRDRDRDNDGVRNRRDRHDRNPTRR
jgi:hypothetical protein